jgi:hypothetical protein
VFALAAVLLLAACQRVPPLTEDPRPWERGRLVSDPEFEENPHIVPRRIRSYDFFVFRKGRSRPFTLFYRQFDDTDNRWLDEHPFRNLPRPFTLGGRRLVVRLASYALQPWKESILVPDHDVVEVSELPFPRFPGAVLERVFRRDREKDLLEDGRVSRDYVTIGSDFEGVLAHYQLAIGAFGIPIGRRQDNPAQLRWLDREQPIKSVIRARVQRLGFAPVPARDLGLEEVRTAAPTLFLDFPADAVLFGVTLEFADVETAAAYWTAEDQRRRRVLLQKQPTKE